MDHQEILFCCAKFCLDCFQGVVPQELIDVENGQKGTILINYIMDRFFHLNCCHHEKSIKPVLVC